MPDKAEDLELDVPMRPVRQPTPAPATPLLPRSNGKAEAITPPFSAQPSNAQPSDTQPGGSQTGQSRQPNNVEAGTLVIGREISFLGEITACNKLIVDGNVEASLQGCQEVLIGETGFFKGQARTENAEVSGRIEGDLIVRKRLLIRAAGQVSGTTTYGEIEIERGGRIIGEAQARDGARQAKDW